MTVVLVNGEKETTIPADDPGLYLGLTVFETMRTYGCEVFRLDRHLARMEQSAGRLGIAFPRSLIRDEILAHRQSDVRIRYTVTAGGNRILDVAPIDATAVGRPVTLATVPWEPPAWLPGVVKHGSRASWNVAARYYGVDEVLLVDKQGHILETNRSNVFAVLGGRVVTPPLDGRFLEGVTRGALLEAASRTGLPLEERTIGKEDRFEELYLSGTLKGLAPVLSVDGREAAGGGEVGLGLWEAFQDLVRAECVGS